MTSKKTQYKNVRLEREVWRTLKVLARAERTSLSFIVSKAITTYQLSLQKVA